MSSLDLQIYKSEYHWRVLSEQVRTDTKAAEQDSGRPVLPPEAARGFSTTLSWKAVGTEAKETQPVANRYSGLWLGILGSVAVLIHRDQHEVISSPLQLAQQ